jgi:hypothetical protein
MGETAYQVVIYLVILLAIVWVAIFGPAGNQPGGKTVRLAMALIVRRGKKFPLKLTKDPVDSQIDTKDVPVVVESSDPSSLEATLDADGETIHCRTLAGGTGTSATVRAKADADQDAGEVRILDATFEVQIVDSVTEPNALGLELSGPVEDDV